ncbi:hypothetical protein, partial [Mesorhizobium sp.]|uniref:hypothetical protein n=1 Tax=Mesorhizobium sp. TaxID=1871066 RepID=UPI00257CF1E9
MAPSIWLMPVFTAIASGLNSPGVGAAPHLPAGIAASFFLSRLRQGYRWAEAFALRWTPALT